MRLRTALGYGPAACCSAKSVADLRQRRPLAFAQAEPAHFAVQRGARHAERGGGFGDVAVRPRQGAAQHGAFGGGEAFAVAPLFAENRLGRQAGGDRRRGDGEGGAGGARRPDDEIVGVDRQQRRAELLGRRRDDDARLGESAAEMLGFDALGRLADRNGDQADELFGVFGAAGGDVERRGEAAAFVEDRRRRAGEQRVAREKVLARDGSSGRAARSGRCRCRWSLRPPRSTLRLSTVPRRRTSCRRRRRRAVRATRLRDRRTASNSRRRRPRRTDGRAPGRRRVSSGSAAWRASASRVAETRRDGAADVGSRRWS